MILTRASRRVSAKLLRDKLIEELGWEKPDLLVSSSSKKVYDSGGIHLNYGTERYAPYSVQKTSYNGRPYTSNVRFMSFIEDRETMQRVFGGETMLLSFNTCFPESFPIQVLSSSGIKWAARGYEELFQLIDQGKVFYNDKWLEREKEAVKILIFYCKEYTSIIKNDGSSLENRLKRPVREEFVEFVIGDTGKTNVWFCELELLVTPSNVCYVIGDVAPELNEVTASFLAEHLVNVLEWHK